MNNFTLLLLLRNMHITLVFTVGHHAALSNWAEI